MELTEDLIEELNEELDKMSSCFFFILASQNIATAMLKDTNLLENYKIQIDLTVVRFINNWFLKRGLEIKWNNSNSSFYV